MEATTGTINNIEVCCEKCGSWFDVPTQYHMPEEMYVCGACYESEPVKIFEG